MRQIERKRWGLGPALLRAALLLLFMLVSAGNRARAETLAQSTGGDVFVGYTSYYGQSVTTPAGGPFNNIRFNFVDIDPANSSVPGKPIAAGTLFVLDRPYLGTPTNLGSSAPGFVAQSSSVENGIFVFASSVVLRGSTTYYFYTSTSPGAARMSFDNPYAGGISYFTSNGTDTFHQYDGYDYDFRLMGDIVTNSAPVISSVTITPTTPNTTSTVTANVAASDVDGDTLSYIYVWRKNGTVITGETGSTLALATAGNGDKGDSITVTVVAIDGTASSVSTTSDAVTLINSVPGIASVMLSPAAPLTTSVLTANLVASDIDNDRLTYTYVWKKNDSILVGETGKTLDLGKPGNGDDDDTITVTVTANDGSADGASLTSESVSISNRAPVVESVSPQSASDKVGAKRTFTVTVSDGNGAGDIKDVWLLINTRLNWGEGATLIYVPNPSSPTNGLLYLRRGDAFLPPMAIGTGSSSSAVLDNGAIRVVRSEVIATVLGNAITLTIPATIRDSLVGQNRLFARVQDQRGATDPSALNGDNGYIRSGTYTVTAQFSGAVNRAPTLSNLNPTRTNTVLNSAGIAPAAQNFGFFVKDEDGLSDIESVWFVAGKQINWAESPLFVYQVRTRHLFLHSGSDRTGFIDGGIIGSTGILRNGYARVDMSKVKLTIVDGKSFGLTLPIQINRGQLGENRIWLRVQDNQGATAPNGDETGFVQSGTWSITQGSAPANLPQSSNSNS